jgi:hypothetical protein
MVGIAREKLERENAAAEASLKALTEKQHATAKEVGVDTFVEASWFHIFLPPISLFRLWVQSRD